MPSHRPHVRFVALLAAGALGVVPLAVLTPSPAPAPAAADSAVSCPPGTVQTTKTAGQRAHERQAAGPAFQDLLSSLDAASADVLTLCRPVRQPEPFAEMAAMQAEQDVLSAGPLGYTPPGAVRAAWSAKAHTAAAASSVPGAQGRFTPLGTTPLISDDERFDAVNGTGLADLAGRVDSLSYDPVNKRLFSAPGTGGVWVSTDLGDSWRSVGDALPNQSVGAVAWSPAGSPADGTLLVVSGEASAGGNVYTGTGAYYSTDSGATWQESAGIPDGLMGFQVTFDPTQPTVVYAATSQGLYRSTDAGKTYVNVKLPTGDCAGVTGYDNICQNANWVTDVVVQAPGGTTNAAGGRVIAAVGYRAGRLPYPGTATPQSPRNGLYRSETGEPGSFEYLEVYSAEDASPIGFAPQRRIGRTELGAAVGRDQNHDYLYAIVQDAVLFNGGTTTIDAYDPTVATGPSLFNTALNGIYVSPDFGSTWTRMADDLELQSPLTESALIGLGQTALLYAPGIQSWYNMWIKPDPTMADANGVPTRLVFGLEEVWESRFSGEPQDARAAAEPVSFKVIGPYFADEVCSFQSNVVPPYCPTTNTTPGGTTTHPDHQGGTFVPNDDGGVSLVVGHDGGVNVQTVGPDEAFSKEDWGRGANHGFHTLLPYYVAPAQDGTVWYGLQDNGSGKIEPDGKQVMTYGGDGFFVAVDPTDSDIAYSEHTFANMRVTQDGGQSWRTIRPPVSAPLFSNPFVMDPTDPQHLMAGGPEIVERTQGAAGGWTEVYNVDPDGEGRQVTAVALHGDAAYAAFCGVCDIINKNPENGQIFSSGIATNVGGDEPPEAGTPAGWHIAAAKGLPDRYITAIVVDPADAKTLYVTLAGYANRQWWPVGSFNDGNPNIGQGHVFKSTDGGETFTDISGSLPDVPARSIELNRGQLLVGTDIGMFLSNNTSGQRWTAPDGLPNVPVTSIRNMPGKPNEVVLSTFGRGVYKYTFGGGLGARVPAASPVFVQPAPDGARLPATGLGLTAAAVGALALLGALAVRRRTHA